MKSKKDRDFKGIWIPREIYLNEELSSTEKILLVEIHSLDKGEGCFASAQYFADFMRLAPRTINDAITHLEELGLISVKKEGRTRRFYSSLRAENRLIGAENRSTQAENRSNFSEKEPINGSTEPEKEDEEAPNNTINNTSNNITTTDVVVEERKKVSELPLLLGKNPLVRLATVYSLLWLDTFDIVYKPNYGLFGRVLTPLLKDMTEWQVAALICEHFTWYGTTGEDEFAHKNLESNGFPIYWIPNKQNDYIAYINNARKVNWDDHEQVKSFVRENIKAGYLEAVKRGIIKVPEKDGESS